MTNFKRMNISSNGEDVEEPEMVGFKMARL